MIFKILAILSFLADLTSVIVFLGNRKVLKNKVFSMLFVWSILSFVFDLLFLNASQQELRSNTLIFIILETTFVFVIYFSIARIKWIKYLTLLIGLAFLLTTYFNFSQNQPDGFPNWIASLAATSTILLSALLCFDMFRNNDGAFVLENPSLFIIFGYLIYASGNLFLFILSEQNPDVFNQPGNWAIYLVSNIIKNIFFVLGITQKNKKMNQ